MFLAQHVIRRLMARREFGPEAKATVPVLIETLKAVNWEVRGQTVAALREIGDPSAVPAICEMLKDQYPYVREVAAETLRKINTYPKPKRH